MLQNYSNYYKNTIAAEELTKSAFVWSKTETIPLPILLGIIGRIIQFNSYNLKQTINQVLQIFKIIRQHNRATRILFEIIKTLPYVLLQLTTRILHVS